MHDLGAIFAFAALTVCVGSLLYYRHKRAELNHIERMAAMEKGLALPVFEQPQPRQTTDPIRGYLLSGLIWFLSGAALAVFLFALSATVRSDGYEYAQAQRERVESLRKLGASDQELIRVARERPRENARIPIGLGTIGLIPMGVGLAYLIFYAAERKRFSQAQ